MPARITAVLVLLTAGLSAFAQTTAPTSRPTDEQRLTQAEAVFAATDLPAAVDKLEWWPSLTSGSRAFRRHLSPERAALVPRQKALADLVLTRIAAYEKANLPLTRENLQQRLKIYQKLGNLTLVSGGYMNLVLYDTVRKLTVEHLSSWLIAHPDEVKQLVEWRLRQFKNDTFSPVHFTSAVWLETRHGDAILRIRDRLEGEQAAIEIARLFETTGEKLLFDGTASTYESRGLMDEVAVEFLMFRLVETDAILKCYFDALADYLLAGGKLADITTNGEAWSKLMKGRQARYRSEFLRVQVEDIHLAKFIEQHRSLDKLTYHSEQVLK